LASKYFGVGERSIYKTLRTGKYHLWRDAEKAVDEFVVEIKKVMDNPRTYRIEMEEYSWKSKARELEDLLEEVLIRGAKIY
jgi:glycosyltransferase involved in cell wall biosynthesis